VYESGREGDMPLTGFSPRSGALTLYIKCLDDVHTPTLKKLIRKSVQEVTKKYKV
jgi:hypothetical protein